MWRISLVLLVAVVFQLTGCQESKEKMILENHRKSLGDIGNINCIITKADCEGPDGKYSTLTESTMAQQYLFFEQVYSYKSPFMALVNNYSEGFGLDSVYDNAGHISTAMIGVLKAHEFHKLMFVVEERYSEFEYTKDTTYFGRPSFEVKATDPLQLPVKFYFDIDSNHMNGFTQRNPYKKSELIQIFFSGWYEHEGVSVFDKVEVLQGKTARYSFDYSLILFNDPTFEKKNI